MILGLLLACLPPADPLAEIEAALALARQVPLAQDWQPQATLALGSALVDGLVGVAVDDMLAELPTQVETWTPFGMTIQLTPGVSLVSAHTAPAPGCSSCLDLHLALAGDTGLVLTNETGQVQQRQSWTATSTSRLQVSVEPEASGDALVVARAVDAGSWELALALPAEQEPLQALLNSWLQLELLALVGSGRVPPIELARLQRDAAVQVRQVRIRAQEAGLVLEEAILLPEGLVALAEPPPVPTGDRWTASVPAGTLLGAGQAFAVAEGPIDGVTALPVSLTLSEGRFALGLRLWPPGRSRPLGVVVEGSLILDPEAGLRMVPTEAHADRSLPRDFDPVAWLLRSQLHEELVGALDLAVPAQQSQDVEGGTVVVEILELRVDQDRVELGGSLTWQPDGTGTPAEPGG